MKELVCTTENAHSYRIVIEKGLKDRLHEVGDVFTAYKKLVIISDKNVAKLYLSGIKKQLKRMGCEVASIVVPAGEDSKCLSQVESIYYQFMDLGMTRSDAVIALGGGVVGDLAGFCAATYLRGIDFIQMPTSLLAQVDSSVGGKVGVDLGFGKNLVGAFHQPRIVIIDPGFLETLDDHYIADGMGEVIKYGCISSAKLFVRLMGYEYQEDLLDDMEEIIAKCVLIKKNVVESDEKEGGIRRVLNFGHTIGHVVESYFEFKEYSHGEAVAIGMYQITKMSVREGLTTPETLDNLRMILETYGLPYEMPEMEMKRVQSILFSDKKFENDVLNLCVIPKIGKAEIVKIQKDKAIQLFE